MVGNEQVEIETAQNSHRTGLMQEIWNELNRLFIHRRLPC